MWKSSIQSPALSYCDPQRGQGFYPSQKFSSAGRGTSSGLIGDKSLHAISDNATYWTNKSDAVKESFAPVINQESDQRGPVGGNGCRLFGIQLLESPEVVKSSPLAVLSRDVGDGQQPTSVDTECEEHSEPSDSNRCENPSASGDAEKSSLRSPQESQGRQIRSCTKVSVLPEFSFSVIQNMCEFCC